MFTFRSSRMLLLLSLLAVVTPAAAQTTVQQPTASPESVPVSVAPPDVVWFATVYVKQFTTSPFGQQVLGVLEQAIREEPIRRELGIEDMPDLKILREKLARVVGFDPLERVESITMYSTASPFGGKIRNEEDLVKKMASTTVVVVKLDGTTGNLEGFALATPDYQSTQYNGATIHSGTLPDFPLRIFMAVLKQGTGQSNIVVFGLNEELVKQAMDRASGKSLPTASPSDAEGMFFAASLMLGDEAIRMLEIPQQQSAVFKMLQSVALSGGFEDDSVFVQLSAELVNEERAEQVRQLLEGLLAIVQLPIEELEKEEEFMIAREILKDVKVSRVGSQVVCRLTKPTDDALKRIRELLDMVPEIL